MSFYVFEFWKEYEWRFGNVIGRVDNVGITLVTSQDVYTLDTATIGKEMRVNGIDTIYSVDTTYRRTLELIGLNEMRVKYDDADTGFPTKYAMVDNNRIKLYPRPSSTENGQILYIDGRVLPTPIADGDSYPDIPIEYQSSFIQYVLARTLKIENNPRANEELSLFYQMKDRDMKVDLTTQKSSLRFKYEEEESNKDGSDYSDPGKYIWSNWD